MKRITSFLIALFCGVMLLTSCDKVEGPFYQIMQNEDVTVTFPDVDPASVYRKILIEEFTGHRCTNCPAGHQILDQLHQRYGDTLVMAGIHYGALAKPIGETFSYDFRTSEGNILGEAYNIDAIPKAIVNREMKDGGWSREQWTSVVSEVDRSKATAAVQIINEYDPNDMTLKVNTKMTMLEDYNNPLRIIIFLVEDGIVKPQKDGNQDILEYTHNHVLRAYLTDAFGYILRDNQLEWHAGDNEVYAAKIDCSKTDWVMGNCHVVVALYDPLAIKVLQVEEANVINR